MDNNVPYAGVQVIEGEFVFSVINGEESREIKSGEQVGFEGILEFEEIAFDTLLKGKKIPKGKMLPAQKINKVELENYKRQSVATLKIKSNDVDQKKKSALEKLIKNSICRSPYARFNECSWVCQNNPKNEPTVCRVDLPGVNCIRQRCNANGEWGDEIKINSLKSSIRCKATPFVSACDY
jgi:hypothetical protein